MSPSPSKIRWNLLAAFPWHVLFISLYAPLQLGAHNIGQIPVSFIYRSVLVSGLLGIAILVVFWVFLRNRATAGIAATLILVLILSYGHVYHYIEDAQVGGFLIGRHRYLALLWAALAVAGLTGVLRKSVRLASLASMLNTITAILLVFPLIQLALYGVRSSQSRGLEVSASPQSSVTQPVEVTSSEGLRDVYYIVLDAYGRSDDLMELFGYDNSTFLKRLRDMGFFVAECSQSNYSKTDLSLSSSLNMEYVTALDPSLSPEKTDRLPLWNLIKNNAVKAAFEELGYTTISFETGFDFSHFDNLDIFYTPPGRGFNEFEILYLRTTLAVLLDEAGILARFHYTPEDRKRELIFFDLETLPEIPALPGPKFVFAHLVIPHQPFVFAANGDPLVIAERVNKGVTYYTQRDYELGYRNQVIFISDQIARVVQDIIQKSTIPPVIIIQGHHGPSHFGKRERMGILNAYNFPDAEPAFYDTITPVNSFRLLFNTYFGTSRELLEDVSYYSEYPEAYRFESIPNRCNQ